MNRVEQCIRGLFEEFSWTDLKDLREARVYLGVMSEDSSTPSVNIGLCYHYINAKGNYLIEIELLGVKQFNLGLITTPTLSIAEMLEVLDIRDRGWEDCSFEFVDMTDETSLGFARNIELVRIENVDTGELIDLSSIEA